MVKRMTKNKINLNLLKRGCSPCLAQSKKIENKIGKRNISEIKIDEVKKIISSLFNEKK